MKHLVTCLKFSSLLTTYSKKERKKQKHQNCCFECPWRSPSPRLQLSQIRKSKSLFNLGDAFDTDLPILLRQVQITFGTLGTVLSWTESIPTFVDGVPEGFWGICTTWITHLLYSQTLSDIHHILPWLGSFWVHLWHRTDSGLPGYYLPSLDARHCDDPYMFAVTFLHIITFNISHVSCSLRNSSLAMHSKCIAKYLQYWIYRAKYFQYLQQFFLSNFFIHWQPFKYSSQQDSALLMAPAHCHSTGNDLHYLLKKSVSHFD